MKRKKGIGRRSSWIAKSPRPLPSNLFNPFYGRERVKSINSVAFTGIVLGHKLDILYAANARGALNTKQYMKRYSLFKAGFRVETV
jgi:hypothetical protein